MRSTHVRLVRLSTPARAGVHECQWQTRVTLTMDDSQQAAALTPRYTMAWTDEHGARVRDTWGMSSSDWATCVARGWGADSSEAIALMLTVVYNHGAVESFAYAYGVQPSMVDVHYKSPRAKTWREAGK